MNADRIGEMARIMRENGLTRMRVEEDGTVVELECAPSSPYVAVTSPGQQVALVPDGQAASVAPAAAPDETTPAPQGSGATGEDAPSGPGDSPLDMSRVHEVTAPMVGVFYAAPSPGAEPFVEVGAQVREGDTLCVIEAMKLMNEVVAERDGEVVDICVSDGELVEFGATIMKIY